MDSHDNCQGEGPEEPGVSEGEPSRRWGGPLPDAPLGTDRP